MKIKGRQIILSDKDNSSQDSFDKILRKFKKLTRDWDIIRQYREHSVFVKPSEKRRKKRMANQRSNKRRRENVKQTKKK